MTMTNGHSLAGARRTLLEIAIKKGISPTYRSIARAAGLSTTTVANAFGAPGPGAHAPHCGTMGKLAAALGISLDEMRRLHATLQLEEAPKPEPKPAPVVKSAPPAPRDLWAELTEAALTGATVVVVAYSEDRGQSIVRGIVVDMHQGVVGIMAPGDSRPARVRQEYLRDVRFPGSEKDQATRKK